TGLKFFIDHAAGRWLKVESSGAKWMNSPLDTCTTIFHLNVSLPENSGIPSTRKIESRFLLAGVGKRQRNSFSCRKRPISFSSSCPRARLRERVPRQKQIRAFPHGIAGFFCATCIHARSTRSRTGRGVLFCPKSFAERSGWKMKLVWLGKEG